MKVRLRPITAVDLPLLERWANGIKAQQYQSRNQPDAFNGKDFSCNENVLWCWYIIAADEEDLGTIWLEKQKRDDREAVLGIMIGKTEKFGKGIGREAIRQAIERSQGQLDFQSVTLHVRKTNTRAICCYEHCGFTVTEEGINTDRNGNMIAYQTMKLSL